MSLVACGGKVVVDGSTDAASAGAGGQAPGTCDALTCGAWTIEALHFTPCCSAEDPATCGVDASEWAAMYQGLRAACLQLEAPGAPDPACPTPPFVIPHGETTLPGCCLPTGRCGAIVDLTTFGGPFLGCQSLSDPTSPSPCTPAG